MELAVTLQGNVAILKIDGDIVDGKPAERLQMALRNLIQEKKVDTIVDCTGLEWFDSVAIGIFVSHYVSITRLNGRVLFMRASERIKTLMKMARLEDRFGWAENLDEALSWFGR